MLFSQVNGGFQIRTINRECHNFDEDRRGAVSAEDFDAALQAAGVVLRSCDVQALAKHFSRPGLAGVDYHEFLSRLRYASVIQIANDRSEEEDRICGISDHG